VKPSWLRRPHGLGFGVGLPRCDRRLSGREAGDQHAIEGATDEILSLHGQKLCERLAPVLLLPGHDHRRHAFDAIGSEEHVLRAARANPLGAKVPGGFGVARNVRIGPDTELAPELIDPAHEPGENARTGIGLLGLGLALEDLSCRAVQRQPFSLRRKNAPGWTDTQPSSELNALVRLGGVGCRLRPLVPGEYYRRAA
jgi:hypothetical protein